MPLPPPLARRDHYECCAATTATGYELKYPIEHGIVTNWTDMKKITPQERPVSLTDALLNPNANRERMTQITFETFNVPALYAAIRTTSSLCASGHTTGTVTIPGDGVSHTVSIYEGYTLHHAILRWPGRDLTEKLMKNLTEQGVSFTAAAEREIAREVKEKLRCFGADYDTELKCTAEIDKEKTDKLPDGNVISVDAERFHSVEKLIQPNFFGKEANGCNDTAFKYSTMCDADIHKNLYVHVMWSGGTIVFQRIFQHMTKELTTLAPSTMKIKDVLPDDDIITVAPNVSCGARVLFQPCFTHKQASGVHDTSSSS